MLVKFSADSSTSREDLARFLGVRPPDETTDDSAQLPKVALVELQKFRHEIRYLIRSTSYMDCGSLFRLPN